MKPKYKLIDGLHILCPECGTVMGNAGAGWSGRKKWQSHKCPNCGRGVLNIGQPFVPKRLRGTAKIDSKDRKEEK